MKRRLFWKILIGFWLTFFCIVHGTWLLFMLQRSGPSDYALGMARMSVAAASAVVRDGGTQAYDAEIGTWSTDQRRQIELRPAQSPGDDARPVLARSEVRSPDGKAWRITFYRQPFTLRGIPREVLMLGGAGGLLFSAILAWYLTQPVRRMRTGFRRLAQGDFSTRLGPSMGRRRDEIADLAQDFDQMAAQLSELVAARDRLLADVSHELRTPLARLNLAIGLARQDPAKLDASLDRIGNEAAKLDEMVGELLTLSKLESGMGQSEDYFDFAEIVRSVAHDAGYEASAKQVVVSLDTGATGSEWLTNGNGRLVSRAVENIVRNAVRYSPQGGQVEITLSHDADFYRLTIADKGPGVPCEEIGLLFKPFGHSADGFGFGLGLAIAQRAIAVNGGAIVARNRDAGGLEMTVTVPAARLDLA
jgi:two-component system OmpR family sensor kinase